MTKEEAAECVAQAYGYMKDWDEKDRDEVFGLVDGIFDVIHGHKVDFAKIAMLFVTAELTNVWTFKKPEPDSLNTTP